MLRSRSLALVGLAAASVLLAACTSGSSPAPTASPSVSTSTVAPTAAPSPVSGGPTTSTAAASCSLVSETFVHKTLGVRLGRLTVLRSGGRVVGCRFYAQQHPDSQCDATCLGAERLPGPNQPAVEITTQRYASSTAAHNAFVLRAGTSPGVTQTAIGSVTGVCFQNAFDPQDKGADWACTVNKGPVLVLVRTVDTTGTYSTAAILTAALRTVAA